MRLKRWARGVGVACCFIAAFGSTAIAADRLLIGTKVPIPVKQGDNPVLHRCLTPDATNLRQQLGLEVARDKPWSLPTTALADGQQAIVRVLVLRFNFQFETVDDPNTTGRGVMSFARPMADSGSAEYNAYYDSVGHWIDPPPHNADYFDAHLQALENYWTQVSEGHIELSWNIFPTVNDSAFTLPHPMAYYGRCDSVVIGLEDYFEDCIRLADTVHLIGVGNPNIDFSAYDAIILFHAGSDRQNDIGFPETCSDLFTGFIRFGDSIAVDGGAKHIRTALLMPETSSQDNRATALNAVLAHEFGHQLGLVDLYRTDNFLSQLGDFSLMDNNGFSTGIDFGFATGQVFGAIPVYPDAWSRAYLGYVPVVDFRQGSDVRVVAAEVASSGIKIARVPISENEFYLIENRLQDIDGAPTAALADSLTNVIQGPVNFSKEFTGEYDFLSPGSGMLIYHIDEGVAGLDYDADGMNNFEDNDLQNDPSRKFVTLIEADGFINFGGFYRAGYGSEADMYRDDRNRSFTPNTNPPSIDNSGNNTRVFITNITRDTIRAPGARDVTYLDSVMLFDLETDGLASGFPVRVGTPVFGISPIAEDLDGNGSQEVIVTSGRLLSIVTHDGGNWLLDVADTCAACPRWQDSAFASVHPGRPYDMPLFYIAGDSITSQPVVGRFEGDTTKVIAVANLVGGGNGAVQFLQLTDDNDNGLAEALGNVIGLPSVPIAMAFSDSFLVSTDSGYWPTPTFLVLTQQGNVFAFTDAIAANDTFLVEDEQYHGLCLVGNRPTVMSGNSNATSISVLGPSQSSYTLPRYYNWGPVVADMDRDGQPELMAASPDGWVIYVTVDTSGVTPTFMILEERKTEFTFTANPVVGDVDLDGYPDLIIGGRNSIYSFDQRSTLKTDFPIEINDHYPWDSVIAAPIQAELTNSGAPEMVFPTSVGNIYSYGLDETYGFPLSGGELGVGSPVVFRSGTDAKLGYLGLDGWFYAWDISTDTTHNFWPMYGHDATGSFSLPGDATGTPKQYADNFLDRQFFNYPNPVTNGTTNFRYFLGTAAQRVALTVFDLSGKEIASMAGSAFQGENELPWQCSDITPGVYRCRIVVDFPGETKTAFTDVAIIR